MAEFDNNPSQVQEQFEAAVNYLQENNPILINTIVLFVEAVADDVRQQWLSAKMLVATHDALHAASAGARAGYDGYQLPTVADEIRFGLVRDITEAGMPAFQVAAYERMESADEQMLDSLMEAPAAITPHPLTAKEEELMRVSMLMTHELLRRQKEADELTWRMAGRVITRAETAGLQDYLLNSQIAHDEPEIRMFSDADTAELRGLVLVD